MSAFEFVGSGAESNRELCDSVRLQKFGVVQRITVSRSYHAAANFSRTAVREYINQSRKKSVSGAEDDA